MYNDGNRRSVFNFKYYLYNCASLNMCWDYKPYNCVWYDTLCPFMKANITRLTIYCKVSISKINITRRVYD